MLRAYMLLRSHRPEQAVLWAEALRTIDPENDYVFTMSKMNNANRMINWNAIMISGEYLRWSEHLASEDTTWMDRYLEAYHLPRFTRLACIRTVRWIDRIARFPMILQPAIILK